MFIQTESTPNPNAVKFIPGTPVSENGTFDFRTPEEAMAVSPLAKMIFEIGDVTGVYLGANFVSVTKDETSDWAMVKPRVLAAIMDHSLSGIKRWHRKYDETFRARGRGSSPDFVI